MKKSILLFLLTLTFGLHAQVILPHEYISPAQQDSLFAILNSKNAEDFFVAPNIPQKKLTKARAACEIDSTGKVYALIDLTVSGKANNCLLICNSGIYIHNGGTCSHPGRYFISYPQLKSLLVVRGEYMEVNIGPISADISGSAVKYEFLIELLEQIKLKVCG